MWVATAMVLVALAPAQDDKKAEELFKKMEDKVHAAKAVEFESDTVIEGKTKGSMNVKALYTEGNKGNFTMKIEADGRTQTVKAISDGKNTRHTEGDNPARTEETPRNMTAGLSTMLTRLSMTPMAHGQGDDDPFKAEKFDKDKFLGVSDFKFGKKEKVGEVEAQVVEYKVRVGEKGEKASATVWIDPKTNLPVKRLLEFNRGGNEVKVTETIKTFKLDGKIDPKTFELPKE